MKISESNLDDLMHRVLQQVKDAGNQVNATRGHTLELMGLTLELTDPRARLSRTETKGRVFSALGELLWYLSKTNQLDFVYHYITRYKKESEDKKTVHGGYGPRLFAMCGYNQISNVIRLLKRKRTSRRAVIQIFEARDIAKSYKEIPCTCTMQFLLRDKKLFMFTFMRSNDAFFGLPHDIFAFTMLQEIIARSIGCDLGTYTHFVGSMHIYDHQEKSVKNFLKEGYQSILPMPQMPKGDPWPAIKKLLVAEEKIRTKKTINLDRLGLNDYWMDIAYLLSAFKEKDIQRIIDLKARMSTEIYDIYLDKLIEKIEKPPKKTKKKAKKKK